MPGLAPDGLREAADPLNPAPGEPAAATPAEARALAKAVRDAITRALKERAALIDTTDAELMRLIEQGIGRVLALLAEQPSDYQLWVLPRLIDSIERIAAQLAAESGQTASAAMGQAWTLGVRAVTDPLAVEAGKAAAAGAAALAAGAMGTADLGQLRALQAMTTNRIKGAGAATVAAINQELGQVVLGVQSPFEAQKAIGAMLKDRTSAQLRAITNLSLAQTFNTATFRKLQAQAATDPGLMKQWRRSGKRHSRWNHDAIDGTVVPVNEPFVVQPGNKKGQPVKLMYPCDPAAPIGETINCGCALLSWRADWKMLHKGAKPFTEQELRDRALRAKPRGKAKPKPPQTTQGKALAAFGASTEAGATLRDVTGQTLYIDSKVIGSAPAPAALTKGQTDLAAYWTVQALRRPSEVWQAEKIDLGSGEVVRTREFVKRFTAAGQQWVATVSMQAQGRRWVGTKPLVIAPLPPTGTGLRAGVKVYPARR